MGVSTEEKQERARERYAKELAQYIADGVTVEMGNAYPGLRDHAAGGFWKMLKRVIQRHISDSILQDTAPEREKEGVG